MQNAIFFSHEWAETTPYCETSDRPQIKVPRDVVVQKVAQVSDIETW